MSRIAVIAGATGLTGSFLTEALIADETYSEIRLPLRRDSGFESPKIKTQLIDFEKIDSENLFTGADDFFCCLGTTMKQAGSKEAFYKVDFTYVLKLSEAAAAAGVKNLLLVSSAGASEKSFFYYSRVKAEIEKAVAGLPFRAVHIVRPSMLLGPRTEHRAGEKIGQSMMSFFDFLTPEAYKGIESRQVAKAMQLYAKKDEKGVFFHENATLRSV